MPTINGRACVVNSMPVDKVYSDGVQVYGRNLFVQSNLKAGYIDRDSGGIVYYISRDFYVDSYIPTNGATVFTFSSPDYAFKGSWNHSLAMYDSNKKYLGYQNIYSPTQTLNKSNVAYIRFSINFVNEGGNDSEMANWLSTHRLKLERGNIATPWTPAPEDVGVVVQSA